MRRSATAIIGLSGVLLLGACSGYRTTFTPSIALSGEYTDNVEASSENPQSDFISYVTPSFNLATANPKRELSLSYSPSFTHYAESGTDLAIRHGATLAATNRFSRHAMLEFSDTFLRTDDPFVNRDIELTRDDEPDQPLDTTRRQNREVYYANTATTGFRYDFGADDSLVVRYLNGILRNEDPTVEDSTHHEPSVGVTYWFTPRYGIVMNAVYTRGDFSLDTDPLNEYLLSSRFVRRFSPRLDVFFNYVHTMVNFQGEEEDYQVYDATVGVDYHLSPATFFALSGGYFIRNPAETESQGGYVVRGDMARQFNRGAVRLSGGTGYRQTFFGAENLGFTEFYEGTLAGTYRFTPRISGDASTGYTHNTYNDAEDREDDVMTLQVGVNYLIRPWVTTTLRFVRREFESTEPGDSYDENRVTLSFTFVPAQPWVFE